ncbi:hypothetical protein [Sinorhizobium medicae]|uniref:Uncharacterized protein n=1 Tax=Sinorhizobium medicae TaxID=110321 RepID=A0A6G1WUK5_9HYPH|nr:hypothetical protein [Sinorhizobium medicae]MQW73438.1 hypothetical protein [Sinorhizobium medicae]
MSTTPSDQELLVDGASLGQAVMRARILAIVRRVVLIGYLPTQPTGVLNALMHEWYGLK